LKKSEEKAVKIVQDAWSRAYQVQAPRNDEYLRVWQRYKGYNPNISDPYKSNIVMPKLYSTIETIVPRLGKALFGSRPYIPIKSEKFQEAAEPIELALDTYLSKDKFKVKGKRALKMTSLFGTAFLEPYPAVEVVTEKQSILSPEYPWQPMIVESRVPRFRLKTRVWAPWQVYVEPNMMDVDDWGYIITIELVAKESIKKLQEINRFNKNVNLNRLSSSGDSEEKEQGKRMLQGLGISVPTEDSGWGVLARYRTDDRYITIWNGLDVLEDRENPFKRKKKNMIRFAYNEDPMLQNSFWGQGEGKILDIICDKLDETWNQAFDNHDMINQAAIAYREGAVAKESLVMVGGVRIPIRADWQGSLDDAVKRFETMGLPPDFYAIPAVLENYADKAAGSFDIQRGEPSEDVEKTATESSLLATQGDLRSEDRVSLLEALGMTDFADAACSHIDQYASFDDLYDTIGEKAMDIFTMNPNELPGGFDYQFRGSDTIINDFQKRADWRRTAELLRNDPSVRPGAVARLTLKKDGYSDQEIEEIVFNEQELQMQMQIEAMQGMIPQRGGENKNKKAQVPTIGNPAG